MDSEQTLLWWSALALAGLLVGIISGLFGVGGGFLLTPMLTVLFRLPIDIAVGTGLCQMIGAAMAGQIRYARLRQGEAKLGAMMVGGGLVGADLGARIVAALSTFGDIQVLGRTVPALRFWLLLGYVLLLGGVAIWMAHAARRPPLPPHLQPSPGPLARLRIPPLTHLHRSGHQVSIPVVAYLGVLMGLLSGVLGIGGGVILVPLLVFGFGLRMRMAAATGIVVLLATSLTGTLAHARMGHVYLGIALVLLVGSTLGAQWGAGLALRMQGQRLRLLFAALVGATALAVAWDLLRLVFGR